MILIPCTKEEAPPIMRLAKKESKRSPSNYQLGAVIIKGKRVLGRGYNHHRENKEFGSGRFNDLHAEGMAIKNALKVRPKEDLKGSTMIIYRRGHKISRPCEGCEKLIKKYGIKRVIYSTD